MQSTLETVGRLGQGHRARLTFADDREVELRANQTEYDPERRLRLELTTDTPGDRERYRVEAHVDGGRGALSRSSGTAPTSASGAPSGR